MGACYFAYKNTEFVKNTHKNDVDHKFTTYFDILRTIWTPAFNRKVSS